MGLFSSNDEDDGAMWFDDVDEEEINVDDEFKSVEGYLAEYEE